MGVVYRALDSHLDRPVAIKVLPAAALSDPERKRRFVQEAKAASALSHPNIVTIHDIDTVDGVDYIAMEYVPGKSLDRVIGRKGLPLAEALRYAIQIADALSAAHRGGIVHRDLKPANVMVTDSAQVKLLDFGVAKLTQSIQNDEQTETRSMSVEQEPGTAEGTIVGTASYMSPEQAEGKPVDARSDIFSFGSVLYEMVSGRRAFQADSKLATLSAILHQDPKPLAEAGELPHDLEKIVSRCLRKDPRRRFQSTDDLKIALEELKEESESGPIASPRRPRTRRFVLAGILVVATLAAALMLWLTRLRTAPAEAALQAVPLTTYPGGESDPTFSPDGSQVAFTWNGETQVNADVYVKLIDTGAPLRLTTDPARDFGPAWSPDGRFIAFLRQVGPTRAALLQIPALGGPERKLGEVLRTFSDLGSGALSWSPDGKHLALVDRKTPGEPSGIFALSIATGEKRILVAPPAKSIGDGSPAVSPDGRLLVFSRSPSYAVSDLWIQSLSADFAPLGEARQLTFDHRQVRGGAWTADGREIIFVSNRTGSFGLWRIVARGGEAVRVASVGEDASRPAISRPASGRASRLAYARYFINRDIERVQIPTGSKTRLISSTRDDHNAAYSPDGSRIVFSSNRSGAYEIWMCRSDGSYVQPLTSFDGPITDKPAWSPDGRRIAFHSRPEGTADIYSIDADGSGLRRLTRDPGDDVVPTWAHDGRWIYFGSNRTGNHEIWRVPAAGGAAVQVTRNGGIYAQESAGGRFLVYTKTRGHTPLWKAPLSGGVVSGPETQVAGSIFYLNFEVRPEGIYFGQPGSIQFLPLAGGAPTRFSDRSGEVLSISPDRKFVLFSVQASSGGDLMLVENFR